MGWRVLLGRGKNLCKGPEAEGAAERRDEKRPWEQAIGGEQGDWGMWKVGTDRVHIKESLFSS